MERAHPNLNSIECSRVVLHHRRERPSVDQTEAVRFTMGFVCVGLDDANEWVVEGAGEACQGLETIARLVGCP